MSNDIPYNVLLLCTGNSGRSIMGESIFNGLGRGRVRAFSAGSHPTGEVSPFALEVLGHASLPTKGLRSKNWDEFAAGPEMDFVFTFCDRAAGEACPVWPGKPITAHWSFADPAAVQGTDADRLLAYQKIFSEISTRVRLFLSLPIERLDRLALQNRVIEIGRR